MLLDRVSVIDLFQAYKAAGLPVPDSVQYDYANSTGVTYLTDDLPAIVQDKLRRNKIKLVA